MTLLKRVVNLVRVGRVEESLDNFVTLELVVMALALVWVAVSDIIQKNVIPDWVSVVVVVGLATFVFGLMRNDKRLARTAIILSYSVCAPFLLDVALPDTGPDVAALLIPAVVALVLDGWYWIVAGVAIGGVVLVAHFGFAWIASVPIFSWFEFGATLVGLLTARVASDLTIASLQEKTTELKESESLFKQVANSLQYTGLLVTDAENRIIFWNKRMVAMTGYPQDEVLGMNAADVSAMVTNTESRRGPIESIWARVKAGETVTVPDAVIPFHRTGTNGWYARAFAPHTDESGRVIGMVETVRDVTTYRLQSETVSMLNKGLMDAYDRTLEGWVKALDLRDQETEGHSLRVTLWMVRLARLYGMSDQDIEQCRRGAMLHDIGKLAVPDAILRKPGKLTQTEIAIMQTHPTMALDMLRGIEFLYRSIDIPYCHHERWNGGGYPRGLHGTEIPLSARLFALVDVFDAMTSDRPYRAAMSVEDVLLYIRSRSEIDFDPALVDLFVKSRVWELSEE